MTDNKLHLKDTLVIGVTATALFDLKAADALFRDASKQDPEHAITAYRQYMLERENEPLRPGTAYPLVQALLKLKKLLPDNRSPLVEVVIMSRNSPETGVRVLNTVRHLQLDITRSIFTGGESVVDYLPAFDVSLFLSTDAKDTQRVIDSKVCAAAKLLAPPSANIDQRPNDQVRIAFDGDAVLFNEDSELVYQTQGLDAFQQSEDQQQNSPLPKGPLFTFLKKLVKLQERLPGRIEYSPVRIALVTARQSPAEMRAINTLRDWGVYVDESYFLGGLAKEKVLAAFKPHIFFDDQALNLAQTAHIVPSGQVPYQSDSPLSQSKEQSS